MDSFCDDLLGNHSLKQGLPYQLIPLLTLKVSFDNTFKKYLGTEDKYAIAIVGENIVFGR
jgi:hypothetical protein